MDDYEVLTYEDVEKIFPVAFPCNGLTFLVDDFQRLFLNTTLAKW
jgi:hypothetical protein